MSVFLQANAPGIPHLIGKLRQFQNDQLPFALSLAMNRAAKDAVTEVRSHLPSVFELRRGNLVKTFGPFGQMGDVSRGWSNKKQWPALRVVLHSKAHAMALQEDGGVKPQRASEVWIRTKYAPLQRNSRVIQRLQPARVRARLEKQATSKRRRGKPPKEEIFRRGDTVFFRRPGEEDAKPLYIIRKRAVVPPILGFEDIARRTYDAKLFPRFAQAMDQAIRTARRRR